jgi:hypothetical protein
MELKYKFIKHRIPYTGRELSSHWIYRNFNLRGSALVAFTGPARVKEHLVDMVDRKKNREIRSPLMLHFISEYFDMDLEKTILRQRLFISLLAQEINRVSKKYIVERRGNDLYVKDRKLSVAIATLTPVSCVFHTGINIKSTGAPVKIIGLRGLSISPKSLADKMFRLYSSELKAVTMSRAKVRAVL